MADLGFEEMQLLQRTLQQRYSGKWPQLTPEEGRNKLLWLMVELGEAADILKKQGVSAVAQDTPARAHFTEELADVLMYFNDVMLCYGISVEELREAFIAKHDTNMTRW